MKGKNKPFAFRGLYLLSFVVVVYGSVFFFNAQVAGLAIGKSWVVLRKILPILAFVVFFTTLLNFFLRPKKITAHLGKESGAKGWFWALVAGVLSHGPMYAWYPLIEDLRSHGMRDGLIVTFFASRTIKVPLLPMMVDYFGLTFTIVLSFYILIGSVLQGLLLEITER
jgi:uncharacterized membrane protein YraQ (UPF0718 family)